MTSSATPDLLTRTTLELDGILSASSIAQAIHALQRVPGVLLAELGATGTSATVAHDAAVPAASLLAAVASAGVHAKIVGGTAVAVNGGDAAARQQLRVRRLIIVAAAAFAAVTLIDTFVPDSPGKHWFVPLFISAIWVFFFAEAMLGRRP